MITEYVDFLLRRRHATLATSCQGRGRGLHSLHCSGVKPIGCVHKFHHIVQQNVIGSACIACLCYIVQSEGTVYVHRKIKKKLIF